MKIRTVIATIHHTESNRKEEKTVTLFDDKPQYQLAKIFVPELGKRVVFDKTDNSILLPD
ncbi:MAG: hypothetical protein F6J86_44390 [Symploca sp. SIO1B1]|nr:hypothetical protein [Symploca sp. SIO2G7]NES00744.1 hypothetical protein [Symploca sp. SIO1B1]